MGDFLRLREIFLAHFVAHCESYAQDVENAVLAIRVCYCSFLRERKIVLPHFVFFSLIIVKSLQLCGRRQIAEPRKYCLVRVIVFLWHVFSLFLFLIGWEFRVNSLQLVSEPRVRFEWEQW